MKAYLEAKKHDTVLLGAVDRHLQMLPNDRDKTVIHPSEMCKADWCQRSTWHRLMGHTAREAPPVPLRLSLIFETGTESGKKWQKWTRDMGILWGMWECRICGHAKLAWSNELGGVCPAVVDARHRWKYREVPLRHGLVGGHADGLVNPTGDENFIMENKTIGPGTLRMLNIEEDPDATHGQFSRITKVLPDHFRQTQIYMRMSQSLVPEVGPINRGVVIYEQKADQQVREFVIEYDPRWTDHLFEAADDIRWSIDKDREVKCPFGGCSQCEAYEVA
jgi:hypothetical protein